MSKRFWFPLFCLCCQLAVSSDSRAQAVNPQEDSFAFSQGSSMPAWTVPVLRLVSATHVEPTTGVILSNTGLVLVPDTFASPGDEIIVLDGGTDLIRNGRPARLEKSYPAAGLEVLRVKGLKRSGAPFASVPPADGSQVQLTAYPPAELIAEGQPPLKIPATIVVFKENSLPSISGETALPNVTGPLLDSCGNLVGVSMADDIQTIEPSPSTRYQWRDALLQILRDQQIAVTGSACDESLAEPEPEAAEPPVEEAPVEEPEVETETEVQEPEEETDDTVEEPVLDEQQPVEEDLPQLEILPPHEKGFPEEGQVLEPEIVDEEDSGSNAWWWLLAAVVLFGLGLLIHRWRRQAVQEARPSPGPVDAPSAAVPDAAGDEQAWTAPALDSLLLIHGSLANGKTFEASCEISANAINLVIGRGEVDLRIDSAAVSRQHARLNGTSQLLTLSDLGSNNGTSINGVPCLEDEIMYLQPGDTIILGDARFSIEIKPSGPEPAE